MASDMYESNQSKSCETKRKNEGKMTVEKKIETLSRDKLNRYTVGFVQTSISRAKSRFLSETTSKT